MLRYLRELLLIVFLCIIISVRCAEHEEAEKYEALTFTRTTWFWIIYTIKNLADNEYPKMVAPTPMATACPVKSQEEHEFNNQQSLGKNSLFVREVYFPHKSTAKIDYQICETPYKMSVVYYRISDEFQFGFEIYYDKSKFLSENVANVVVVDFKKWPYDLITNSHLKKNDLEVSDPTTKIYLNEQTELGFMWIPMIHLVFNFESKRMAEVIYNLTPATETVDKCDDWNLGIEYFTQYGIPIDDLYSEKYQAEMLKDVILPTSKHHDGGEIIEDEDASCESENQCFTKWLPLPVEHLHIEATKPTSCSYLLAVPIWKSTIEDVLKKLDNFLYAVSIVLDDPRGLKWIHSGVHGDLQLPTSADTTEQTMKTIQLVGSDIPVPDIIYKIIRLRHRKCWPKVVKNNKNDESADSAKTDEESVVDNKNDQTDHNVESHELVEETKNDESKEHSETGEPLAKNDEMKEGSEENKLKDVDKMYEPKKDIENKESVVDNENDQTDHNVESNELEEETESDESGEYEETDESLEESEEDEEPELLEDREKENQDCVTTHAATIVIVHNNPNFDLSTDRICDDRCEEWGWDEIQFREVAGRRFKSKYIYCCGAYDPEVRRKLGIKKAKYIKISRPLALKSVLLPDDDEMDFQVKSIRDTVIKEYKRVFEGVEPEPNENNENDEPEPNENNENEHATLVPKTETEFFKIPPESNHHIMTMNAEEAETNFVDDDNVEKVLENPI